jgi:hypothetical protein
MRAVRNAHSFDDSTTSKATETIKIEASRLNASLKFLYALTNLCSVITFVFAAYFVIKYPRVWDKQMWTYFRNYYLITCFQFFFLSLALLVAICKLLAKIKKFFAQEMKNEARTLRVVFLVFTSAYLFRSCYLFMEASITVSRER